MTALSIQPGSSRAAALLVVLRRTARGPGALWRDRILLGLLATAVAIGGWYVLPVGSVAVRVTAFALLRPAADVALLALVWPLVRSRSGARTNRRFWTIGGTGGALLLAADAVQAMDILRGATLRATVTGPVPALLITAATVCVVIAMLAHPVRHSGLDSVRYRADLGTVVVTAAIIIWYAAFSAPAHAANPILMLGAAVLTFASAAGVARLMLSGVSPVTRPAGVVGGLGLGLLMITTAASSSLAGSAHPGAALVVRLVPIVLLAASPRIQRLRPEAEHAEQSQRAEPRYRLLPYGCVAAAQLLLVVALVGDGSGARVGGVVTGAIAITAFVVVRQFVAFADQRRLAAEVAAGAVALRQQEHRFEALAEHASEMTCIVDRDGSVSYANPAVERVLGYAVPDVIGSRLHARVHPDDGGVLHRTFADLLATPGASRSCDLRVQCADGSWRWLRAVATNLLEDAQVGGVVCHARDVTDARRFSEQLRYEATHDPLTRLANRAFFAEEIRSGGAVSRDTVRESMSIMVLNLDQFQDVNDTHGHEVGDALLRAVAGRLLGCARSMDTVARMGADEFAILLPATTVENGRTVARRMLGTLTTPVAAAGHEVAVQASVGVATGPVQCGDDLLRAAGTAMRAAKRDTPGGIVTVSL